MDKATKNLIEKEAKADAELNRGNAAMSFMEDRINGYIAGATVWAEKLKRAEKLIEAYKHINEMRSKKAGKQVIKNAQNILHTALNEWNSLPD